MDLLNFDGVVETSRGRMIVAGIEVPLAEVSSIVIGSKTRFSGSLIHLAAKFDIPILTCDWRGMPIACTFPWSDNSRVGARFRAQIDLSIPRQKNAWMQIIKAKVVGQSNNLKYITGELDERMVEYVLNVRSGDPSNIEARAARTYWSSFSQNNGFSRTPGQGLGFNSMLDYGYAIIRSVTIRAICEAGLYPTIGIFHKNRSNPFSLADDLMEPFRPAVDYVAHEIGADGSLEDRPTKEKLVGVLTLSMGAKGDTVATSIKNLASEFANYVEGRTQKLDVPIWVASNG